MFKVAYIANHNYFQGNLYCKQLFFSRQPILQAFFFQGSLDCKQYFFQGSLDFKVAYIAKKIQGSLYYNFFS